MRAALGAQAAAAAERLAGGAPGLAPGAEDAGLPLPAGADALVAELAALQGARQYAQGLQVGGGPLMGPQVGRRFVCGASRWAEGMGVGLPGGRKGLRAGPLR